MAKKQEFQINPKRINDRIKGLCQRLAEESNYKVIDGFLRNTLTESEIIMIATRLEIADMLMDGKMIDEICQELRVGANTVRNINNTLKRFLKELSTKDRVLKKQYEEKGAYGTWNYTRKTYKGYYGLINALLD